MTPRSDKRKRSCKIVRKGDSQRLPASEGSDAPVLRDDAHRACSRSCQDTAQSEHGKDGTNPRAQGDAGDHDRERAKIENRKHDAWYFAQRDPTTKAGAQVVAASPELAAKQLRQRRRIAEMNVPAMLTPLKKTKFEM